MKLNSTDFFCLNFNYPYGQHEQFTLLKMSVKNDKLFVARDLIKVSIKKAKVSRLIFHRVGEVYHEQISRHRAN